MKNRVMKVLVAVVMAGVMLLAFVVLIVPISVYADNSINVVWVDGEQNERVLFDVGYVELDGRVYIPVRNFFESLHYVVGWCNDDRRITISLRGQAAEGSYIAALDVDNNLLVVPQSPPAQRSGSTRLAEQIRIMDDRAFASLATLQAVLYNHNRVVVPDSGTKTIRISLIISFTDPTMGGWQLTDAQLAQMVSSEEIPADVQWLSLPMSQISDLTPLVSLTDLRKLNLADNQITDITPLASLNNLVYLNLRGNPVLQVDIDELQAALPNLTITFVK